MAIFQNNGVNDQNQPISPQNPEQFFLKLIGYTVLDKKHFSGFDDVMGPIKISLGNF